MKTVADVETTARGRSRPVYQDSKVPVEPGRLAIDRDRFPWWAEQGLIVHSEFRDGNVPAGHEQLRVLEEASARRLSTSHRG